MESDEIIWDGQEERFAEYVGVLAEKLDHVNRRKPFEAYCMGLLLPGDRKSVEPMAARLEPRRLSSAHQSLHHFVADSSWDDGIVLEGVREQVLPAIERHGKITTWIIDDTGIPKKGNASVGVAHQYCGNLGKQANCQVAVSLSIANDFASLPIAYRLYLPQAWSDDALRREKTGIPEEISFATKPQIALEQIRRAKNDGVPCGVVVADAAYGNDTSFREGVAESGMSYCLAVQKTTTTWRPGEQPLPPQPRKAGVRGRQATRLRRTDDHAPASVEEIARSLPASAFTSVTWREGTKEILRSRFAAARVRAAHRDTSRDVPRPEEWLLIDWPAGEKEPRKYWLSNLPLTTSKRALVQYAQSRWRIERDYQELKDELGIDHYEGRGWRGFHHHGTMSIAAYGFLIKERSAAAAGDFSPYAIIRRNITKAIPPLPKDFRPRGSPNKA